MAPPNEAPQALIDALSRLFAAWPDSEWSWDPRHGCVTSVLAPKAQAAARDQLVKALPHEWNAETLMKAAPEVRALATQCGGLRSGQLLLSGEAVDGSWPYGLWWPWGDGSAVSIRLGIATGGQPDSKATPALRKLFAIRA